MAYVPFERRKKKEKKEEKDETEDKDDTDSKEQLKKKKEEEEKKKETGPYPSPIDLKENSATKVDLGTIIYGKLWCPSKYTVMINTGAQLRLEFTSPTTFKWKPAGDNIFYLLSSVQFYWAFDDKGSCHTIDGQKYALEMILTFNYTYEVTVPSELIHMRVSLHNKYKKLANEDEEGETADDNTVDNLEDEYDKLEERTLNDRYVHIGATEALLKRKPTAFALGKLRNFTISDSDANVEDEENEDDNDDKRMELLALENPNLDRDIKFRKERAIHELAAERFYPFFEERLKKELSFDYNNVDDFLTDSSRRNILRSEKKKSDEEEETSSTIDDSPSIISTKAFKVNEPIVDDPPIDAAMFPTESDKERERARRLKFKEEKKIQDKELDDKKMEWIRKHKVEVQVKVSVLFEVKEDAPRYNLFSYLTRVNEPLSKIVVDGNLLTPFKAALSDSKFFAYPGSQLFRQKEEVIWVVMKTPVPINSKDLWALRSMKNEYGKPMEFTKPTKVEPDKERKIYFNVPENKLPPTCPGKDICKCELASTAEK